MRKFLFLAAVALLSEAQTGKFALTIDNIMRGPGLVGYEPAGARWSGDSKQVFFQWKQSTQKEDAPMDTYVVARDGSGLRKLSDEEAKLAPPAFGDQSKDKRSIVYVRDGDIYVYDNPTGKIRQVTKTTDFESNPRFLADGKRISFVRANNLYVLSLEDGSIEQMTDIRADAAAAAPATAAAGGRGGRGGGAPTVAAGQPPRGNDSQEWIKKEQKELLQVIREKAARRAEDEARRKKDSPRKPFTLQARQSVNGLQLSPDGKLVIATVNEPGNARNTIVPNYVTESAYTEDIPGRSYVGDAQSRSRLALIDVASGDVKYVDHGQKITPPASAATQRTENGSEGAAPPARTPAPQDRDVRLNEPVWSEDGTKAVILARSADNKDRWLFALDPATGKTRVLAHDHDNAWVGGPGNTTLGWLQNDREVYFQSERTGYSHLYAVAFDGASRAR